MKVLVVTHEYFSYDSYPVVIGVVSSLDSAAALVRSRHKQKSFRLQGPTKTAEGYSFAAKYRGNVEAYEVKEFEVDSRDGDNDAR